MPKRKTPKLKRGPAPAKVRRPKKIIQMPTGGPTNPRSHGVPTPTFDRHPPKKTGPRFIDNRPRAGRPGAAAKKSGPHDRHPPKKRRGMGPAAGSHKKRPRPMTKS